VTVAARADTEQDTVAGEVLQGRDLLGDPDHRPQREDQHPGAETDPPGDGRRNGERGQAVQQRHPGAGDELIHHPDGFEAQFLGVTGGRGDVPGCAIPGGHRRQDHAQVHAGHRAGPSIR
jgi:hypothetical protein